jgi:molybdopterin-binding protein
MNQLTGTIAHIEAQAHLSLVQVTVANHTLQALLVETPQTAAYLRVGQSATLLFKETEVLLAPAPFAGSISVPNQLPAVVKSIEQGKLLSRVWVDFSGNRLSALVLTSVLQQMPLEPEQAVVLLIKANEIMFAT